jgi:hypothetical protein
MTQESPERKLLEALFRYCQTSYSDSEDEEETESKEAVNPEIVEVSKKFLIILLQHI